MALTTMVTYMALQAGNARSDYRSVFPVPLRDNYFRAVTTIVAFAVHIGALYFPPTQPVLRVEPIDLAWIRISAVATTILIAVELEKAVRRRARPTTGATS